MNPTAAQMTRIESLLPTPRGNVRLSNRQVIEALLYVRETRCTWRELPAEFGRWHTVYTRLQRWTQRGVIALILKELHPLDRGAKDALSPNPSAAAPVLQIHQLTALADELRPTIFLLSSHLKWERRQRKISQFEIATLMCIEGIPGIGITPMALRLEVKPGTMGTSVRRLATQGWIERSARESADRRRAGFAITPLGRQVLVDVRTGRSQQLVRQFVELGPDQVELLRAALRPLQQLGAGLERALPAR